MEKTIFQNLTLALLIAVVSSVAISLGSEGVPPIADAGLSRYAAQDPIVLDGTGSYDPDNSGTMSFVWQQITGPSATITGTNAATPTIGGLVQTGEIQECEFELIVDDGELASVPDTVKVIIVPAFGESQLRLYNEEFNPDKPTILYFGGGDCTVGYTNPNYGPRLPFKSPEWTSRANIIWFPDGYGPDPGIGDRSYYQYGDMLIVYLSSVAPNYKRPIQTSGWSTGGQPAIDVGIRLNLTYKDPRYAVNHVTLLDSAQYCRDYTTDILTYLGSSVEGEQCWVDNYISTIAENENYENMTIIPSPSFPLFHDNVLNIVFDKYEDSSINWLQQHYLGNDWYGDSFSNPMALQFNGGIVGSAYWSVIGPGKNLQLTSATDTVVYKFRWYGSTTSGYMDFYDEPNHPGILPEPVMLVGPVDLGDPNGAVLTCEDSENTVGYQLLFGSDPYRVMDYDIISDTPAPPNDAITALPFDETWWTVRVRDKYGSTLYADPMHINALVLSLPIENITTGKRYGYIQDAIDEAAPGDEIVLKEGVYHENIDFQGKNLIVRSTDPSDSAVVAATILTGHGNDNLVTFSNNEDASCVLAGLTVTDANSGIFCSGASPTVVNCSITANVGAGVALYMGSNPTISNCIIATNSGSGIAMFKLTAGRNILVNSPTIVNCTIVGNSEIGISEGTPTVLNSIVYGNSTQIVGSSAAVKYSSIQGGFPGEGNIDADPLFADPANGDYHLKSQAGRWVPSSQAWLINDVTSPCIDAGDPGTPIGLEPLPNGDIINMGAYGGTPKASKSP